MTFRRAPVVTLVALALALTGCGSDASQPSATPPEEATEDATVSVVASTDVYGSIARAVGGDRVTVEALIDDPSADPHSYESTPADAVTVSGAQIVVANGGGYDDFVTQLVESSGDGTTVIEVADISGLAPEEEHAPAAEEEHAHGEEEHADGGGEHAPGEEEHAHAHGGVNEHFWYSLPAMQALATQLATELGAADPAGAAEFTANAEAFNGRVGELLARTEAIGATHPGARIAVTEPVPGHLIETAGLTDATPPEFTQAIEEDTDPPAAVLQETLTLFSGDPVRALVVNAQTETPSTEQVREAAQTAGVPVVEMTETLPEGAGDYVSWMGSQVDALAAALNRS